MEYWLKMIKYCLYKKSRIQFSPSPFRMHSKTIIKASKRTSFHFEVLFNRFNKIGLKSYIKTTLENWAISEKSFKCLKRTFTSSWSLFFNV